MSKLKLTAVCRAGGAGVPGFGLKPDFAELTACYELKPQAKVKPDCPGFALYRRLDNLISGRGALKTGLKPQACADLRQSLAAQAPDLLLWLCDEDPDPELAGLARLGLLRLDSLWGESGARRFFAALAKGRKTIETRMIWQGPQGSRELGRLRSGLNPLSLESALALARARLWPLVSRAAHLILGLAEAKTPEAAPLPAPTRIGPAKLAEFLARLVCFGMKDLTRNLLYKRQWFMAWRPSSPGAPWENREPLKPIELPDSLGRADPFNFERKGQQYLFYEEIPQATNRGILGAGLFDGQGRLSGERIVLDVGCHASYPYVFEFEAEIYMIPETGQAGRVDLYRAREFPGGWRRERTLLKGLRAVDATWFEHQGLYWIFANLKQPGGSSWDEMHLYFSREPFGPFTAHPLNPVLSDVSLARPAGRVFRQDGDLIRPAQDCSGAYGEALVFNRILRLDPKGYVEEPLGRLDSSLLKGSFCLHTFNQGPGYELSDGQRYLPRFKLK